MSDQLALSARSVAHIMFDRGFSFKEVQAYVSKNTMPNGYIIAGNIPTQPKGVKS